MDFLNAHAIILCSHLFPYQKVLNERILTDTGNFEAPTSEQI